MLHDGAAGSRGGAICKELLSDDGMGVGVGNEASEERPERAPGLTACARAHEGVRGARGLAGMWPCAEHSQHHQRCAGMVFGWRRCRAAVSRGVTRPTHMSIIVSEPQSYPNELISPFKRDQGLHRTGLPRLDLVAFLRSAAACCNPWQHRPACPAAAAATTALGEQQRASALLPHCHNL